MIWAVTERRIIVWSFARRPGERAIGDYARGGIREVERPTVGGVWRTVRLNLNSGHQVQVQIGGNAADRLAEELRGAQ
jgi:hypothetical protein